MNIGDLDTPAVVIDLDIMERNLRPSAAVMRTSLNLFLAQEFSVREE
jgi:D-serine deaminase-like pyridoxal phosphate-dependent protein